MHAHVQTDMGYSRAPITTLGKVLLSPASKRVRTAYLTWKKHPTSAVQQQAFIEAFPATADVFTAVFNPKDFRQLYDGHEHIFALEQIGDEYPSRVLRRCIAIGKDVEGISDAPAYIHETIVKLTLTHPQLFAHEVTRLAATERRELFHFLANVEGIRDYPDYESLMRLMTKKGFSAYAIEFQRAKQWRLQQPNR